MRFDHERIPEASYPRPTASLADRLTSCPARGTCTRCGSTRLFQGVLRMWTTVTKDSRRCIQVYDDRASKYTYAGVLTDPSRITSTFVRFSTVQGSRGSAVSWPVSARCPRLTCNFVLRTRFAMCADLRPSSIPRRETGISLATTFLCFSSRTVSSFPTLSMLSSRSLTMRYRKASLRTTISGITWAFNPSVCASICCRTHLHSSIAPYSCAHGHVDDVGPCHPSFLPHDARVRGEYL